MPAPRTFVRAVALLQFAALSTLSGQDSLTSTPAIARATFGPQSILRFDAAGRRSQGVVSIVSRDSVFLVQRGVVAGTALRSIDSLWVWERGTAKGAGVGALTGAIIFGAMAASAMSSASPQESSTAGGMPAALMIGGGAGAVVGGLVGAVLGSTVHHWSRRYP